MCILPFNLRSLLQIILLHINKKICQIILCVFWLTTSLISYSFVTMMVQVSSKRSMNPKLSGVLNIHAKEKSKQGKKMCNINYPTSYTSYILIWFLRPESFYMFMINQKGVKNSLFLKLPLHFDSWGTTYDSHLGNFLMTCKT